MPPRVVIMGPQGAGKGTQSRRLADRFDVDHVATGDILRANKDLETDHGTPREYMEAGELVPDEVMAAVVDEALSGRDGYVLDGYPRTLPQAEYLLDVADPHLVLVIEVSRDVSMERLTGRRICSECDTNYHVDFDPPEETGVCDQCGGELIRRDDDRPEAIRRRLEEYHDETQPVVEFFEEETPLPVRHVDGEQSLDEVWTDVKVAVRQAAPDE